MTGRLLDGNSKLWDNGSEEKKLNIYAFPGEKGETVKFNYVDYLENNKEKDFSMRNGDGETEITSPPLSIETVYIVKTDAGPKEVKVNGEKVKWEWDNAYGTVIIKLKEGKENKIQIVY
ncbi:MAG: hypothetical protein P4L35_17830 [Ignavibacteriaceae bacterium]|nr:hypothetical protein [Ignavibacteriaceae bacterium]